MPGGRATPSRGGVSCWCRTRHAPRLRPLRGHRAHAPRSTLCRWSLRRAPPARRPYGSPSASSIGAIPLLRMNAITTSTRSADWISVRTWLPTPGSPGALVRSVVSRSGINGPAIASGLPSGMRARTACSTAPGSTGASVAHPRCRCGHRPPRGAGAPGRCRSRCARRHRPRPTRVAGAARHGARSGPPHRRLAGGHAALRVVGRARCSSASSASVMRTS